MKKISLFAIGVLFACLVVFLPLNNKTWLDRLFVTVQTIDEKSSPKQISSKKQQSPTVQVLHMASHKVNGRMYVTLSKLTTVLKLKTKVDIKNGTCKLIYGKAVFHLVRDVPVINNNGLFQPLDHAMIMNGAQVFIPISAVEVLVGNRVELSNDQQVIALLRDRTTPTEAPFFFPKVPKEQLIQYLSFLQVPIKGAYVSTKNSSLPGAPRTYRKGVHEGIDWYGGETTGVSITKKTPIQSIATGVVVRADHQYREWDTAVRKRWLVEGKQNNGQTPEYILDKLRGRSVWVQYRNGVMARYVHLNNIPASIKVGKKVKQGEIVGFVGNSGTSDGAKRNNDGLHLHLDLLIYGDWFWKHYKPHERRRILERVFDPNK